MKEAVNSIFDLHVHTSEGSIDSALSPGDLVKEAHRIGLSGAVLSEHDGWQGNRFREFVGAQGDNGLVLIHAIEVYTDMGHIITFGLDGYRPGIRYIQELRGHNQLQTTARYLKVDIQT